MILELVCILMGMSQHRERDWKCNGDILEQKKKTEHKILSPNGGTSLDGEEEQTGSKCSHC